MSDRGATARTEGGLCRIGARRWTGEGERIDDLSVFDRELPRLLTEPGPHFVVLPVTNSEPLPPVAHSDHAERVVSLRRGLGLE